MMTSVARPPVAEVGDNGLMGSRDERDERDDGDRAEVGVLPDYAARVLDVVDQVPVGKVVTYGDVAEYLEEGGPRQVGAVMSRFGGSVAWWRVLRADGSPAPAVRDRALAEYRAEGTPIRPDGRRVDLRLARWSGPVGGV
jgi:alkylated DNA nucleotide flippase Atl1